jgi:hypothetical protein
MAGTNWDGDGGAGLGGGGFERELNGKMDLAYIHDTELTDSAIRNLATITQTWNGGNGFGNDPTKWAIAKVPSYSSICVLPDYGAGSPYTVTVNALGGGEILALEVRNHATVKFDGYSLTADQGCEVLAGGTMIVKNATYTPNSSLALTGTLELDNGVIAGAVNTSATSVIKGYGTINNALNSNDGVIRAENGQLSIDLVSDTHNNGTLGAATGGTLYLRNAPGDNELWNKDQIALTGGTLKGSSTSMMLKNYAAGDVISGYGRIENFNVYVGEGTLTVSGGQLQIDRSLFVADYTSTVNVQSGATLHMPNFAWENNNALNLSGGAITGSMLTQDGTLSVTGTGTIQHATFNFARTYRVENGATWKITGQGVLNNATISMGGTSGAFCVDGSGAFVHGRGQIDPDVTVAQGSLYADSAGNTLRLSRSLTVNGSQSAYATGGSALQVDGAAINSGNLYATGAGSTLTCAAAVTNTGTLSAAAGATVALNGNVNNGNLVHATGGTVNINGTIKDGYAGEFRASSAPLNVLGSIKNGADNTFSAYSGGTISFNLNLDTAVFQGDALLPRGGTLTVRGSITNRNAMLAATGGTLALEGTLVHHGQIQTSGSGTVTLTDTAPTGGGTLTANPGGMIRLANGFTNAGLGTSAALLLEGGTIALSSSGTMTNATGKTIRGCGTLLESGQALDNQGLLEATGNLTVNGAVTNSGNTIRISGAGRNLNLNAGLANSGLVGIAAGATLRASTVTNSGRISLDEAGMTVTGHLSFMPDGYLDDNGKASGLTGHGNLTNQSAATGQFAFTHSSTTIFSLGLVGKPHDITWLAADFGAELAGFDSNMAIGSMAFGDGLGMPGSDTCSFSAETILYAYGLRVHEDAALDLRGATLYYLREGLEYNGIRGTGLQLDGSYKNGKIIEIIPEPRVPALFALFALFALLLGCGLLSRRRQRTGGSVALWGAATR